MTVAELIHWLGQLPQHMPARIYLDPDMFPDGVDLNELPGWYSVGEIDIDNIPEFGNVISIKLDIEP